jgi:hypothetical protein
MKLRHLLNKNIDLPREYLMPLSMGVVGVIFVVVMIFFSIFFSIRNAIYLGPFKAHVNEYSIVSGLKPKRTQAYLKGKVITVNKKVNRIDDIYFDLPEKLRATKPEDVGTIVWLEWGQDEFGFYCDESDSSCKASITPDRHHETATVITCHMTIIDKS